MDDLPDADLAPGEGRDGLRPLRHRHDMRHHVAQQVVETTVRPNTHKRYAEYIRVHAVPKIGLHRLRDLRPLHLQRLYAARLEAGASPSTVAHLHAVLRRALTMAERWEYVTRNVARQVTPPSVPRFQLKPLTPDEVRRLFLAAEPSRLEAAIYLAVLTGCDWGSCSRSAGQTLT